MTEMGDTHARRGLQPQEPMSASALLEELTQQEIRVSVSGDQLKCVGPPEALTDTVLEQIRRHKSELLMAIRDSTVIPAVGSEEPPLSFAQERIWLLHQIRPDDTAYNLPLGIHLRGELSVPALRQAVGRVLSRHAVLRTRYVARRGRPASVVTPPTATVLPVIDLSDLPAPLRARARAELATAEARRPFDLTTGPVLRTQLLREGPDEHVLLMSRHHIASDGWSFGILLTELSQALAGHSGGRPQVLPPLKVQYGDFAAWQRNRPATGLDRWQRLAGSPATLALLDDSYSEGARRPAEVVRMTIDRDIADGVRRWATEERVTPFSVLLGAYGVVLSGLSGQTDLVIGSPLAGRERPELERLIGSFVTMLPLRLDLALPTISDVVRHTHDVVLEGLEGQGVPFGRLVEAFSPERGLNEHPLFQAGFAYQNLPRPTAHLAELTARLLPTESVAPKFPVMLTATDREGHFDLDLEFDPDRLAPAVAAEILSGFSDVLRVAPGAPGTATAALAPKAAGASQDRMDDPHTATTLCDLMSVVVAANPDAVAIVSGRHHLTYRALKERADRVAATLVARGVGPDDVVGLCVEPSVDLVVGMLGILCAGAAYLPLDPADPPARSRGLVDDADVRLVVTLLDQPTPPSAARIHLDDLDDLRTSPDIRRPAVHANNLAYIIHTSGSTGEPKGVEVTHDNVTRLVLGCHRALPLTAHPRIWALTHSVAFDFSVWEIWGALSSGGRLVIVQRDVVLDPGELGDVLRSEQVEVVGQTPSAAQHLLSAMSRGGQARSALALVVLGGERCEASAFDRWIGATEDGGPQLVNMYGITETTVHVTVRPLRSADLAGDARSPIGAPLPGVRVGVLSRDGDPVTTGVVGEVVVGGGGVARGYRNRPGPTAARFQPDPGEPGARAFRSGDLARRLRGDLDYQGRMDDQINVRGYRVEPSEVEATLLEHPAISSCAVIAWTAEERSAIAAYLVLASGAPDDRDAAELRAEIRRFLGDRLPRYMAPSALMFVDRIPTDRNGKRDLSTLPAPEIVARETSRPPRTPTEILISELLVEVLGLGPATSIGADDNFFDLGGDSLMLMQFHARVVEAFGIDLPVRRVYRSLDIATLAHTVDEVVGRTDAALLDLVLREVEAMPEGDR